MTGRIIQIIIRFIFSNIFNFKFVDAQLPENQQDKEIEIELLNSSPYIPKNNKNGIANATYGNRFVILPIEYFTSIILNKNSDLISIDDISKLSNKNQLNNKRNCIEDFIEEFEEWQKLFFSSLDLQRENVNEALEYIFRSIPTHFRIDTFQFQTES